MHTCYKQAHKTRAREHGGATHTLFAKVGHTPLHLSTGLERYGPKDIDETLSKWSERSHGVQRPPQNENERLNGVLNGQQHSLIGRTKRNIPQNAKRGKRADPAWSGSPCRRPTRPRLSLHQTSTPHSSLQGKQVIKMGSDACAENGACTFMSQCAPLATLGCDHTRPPHRSFSHTSGVSRVKWVCRKRNMHNRGNVFALFG